METDTSHSVMALDGEGVVGPPGPDPTRSRKALSARPEQRLFLPIPFSLFFLFLFSNKVLFYLVKASPETSLPVSCHMTFLLNVRFLVSFPMFFLFPFSNKFLLYLIKTFPETSLPVCCHVMFLLNVRCLVLFPFPGNFALL